MMRVKREDECYYGTCSQCGNVTAGRAHVLMFNADGFSGLEGHFCTVCGEPYLALAALAR